MMDNAAVLVTSIVVGVLVAIGALLLGVRQVGHHYDQIRCRQYVAASGRETRFVDYSFVSWDCLTPSSDGKWIPISQLREL